MEEGQGAGLMETPSRRYGDDIASWTFKNINNKVHAMFAEYCFQVFSCLSYADTPDRCGKAVMEAKYWLEEKKAGSSSKSDMVHGFSDFGHVPLQNVSNSKAAFIYNSKQLR